MQYTTLGRTGLKVSVAGFGAGGNSRVGQGRGLSVDQSVALLREAFDLGVNFVDTAEAYGTEEIVGKAVGQVPRDSVVVSTKSGIRRGDRWMTGAEVIENMEASLKRLALDHVEVFLLHAVPPAAYDHVTTEILPHLLRQKEAGKILHIGVTETAPNDPQQTMIRRAVRDEPWEVVMLAFHMMNQKARRHVFPETRARGVGTLLMFVVRNIFSNPEALRSAMRELVAAGKVPAALDRDGPLDFLVHAGGAASVTDAAYRFGRHEPGADVVLFGTGDRDHLRANIASILAPPLPAADVERLYALFGELEGVGLDLPGKAPA
ncbi:MAG: aldo/keto reductase [Alphaproteobacteria bacterium]